MAAPSTQGRAQIGDDHGLKGYARFGSGRLVGAHPHRSGRGPKPGTMIGAGCAFAGRQAHRNLPILTNRKHRLLWRMLGRGHDMDMSGDRAGAMIRRRPKSEGTRHHELQRNDKDKNSANQTRHSLSDHKNARAAASQAINCAGLHKSSARGRDQRDAACPGAAAPESPNGARWRADKCLRARNQQGCQGLSSRRSRSPIPRRSPRPLAGPRLRP